MCKLTIHVELSTITVTMADTAQLPLRGPDSKDRAGHPGSGGSPPWPAMLAERLTLLRTLLYPHPLSPLSGNLIPAGLVQVDLAVGSVLPPHKGFFDLQSNATSNTITR